MSIRKGLVLLVLLACVNVAYAMASKPKPDKPSTINVETNRQVFFDLDAEKCLQFGYITGPAGLEAEPQMLVDPFNEISFENNGDGVVRLDGILLNNGGMLFNYDAFCYKYGIDGKITVDNVQRIFWDNYAWVHHAQPRIYNRGTNITRVWNVYGFALCFWQNKVFDDFFYQSGNPIRMVPVFGHHLEEYYLDGKWRLVDFNQRSYYLTPAGDLAGHRELFNDPYLVAGQSTYGPFSNEEVQMLPTMMSQVLPTPIKTSVKTDEESWSALGHAELEIKPGERITFKKTSAGEVVNNHPKMYKFLRKGEIDLRPVEHIAGSEYRIKRVLPFRISNIEIECDVDSIGTDSKATIEVVVGGKSETIGEITAGAGKKIKLTKKLSNLPDDFEILFRMKVAPEQRFVLKDVKVSLGFFYNNRVFWDLHPRNKLTLLGRKGSELEFKYTPNPEYMNKYYNETGSAEFKEENHHLGIAIKPDKKPDYYEYYISLSKNGFPVSPNHYFVDKLGAHRIPKEFLPTGSYKLHYRCFYQSDAKKAATGANGRLRIKRLKLIISAKIYNCNFI